MKREEQYCLSGMHPTLIFEIIRMDYVLHQSKIPHPHHQSAVPLGPNQGKTSPRSPNFVPCKYIKWVYSASAENLWLSTSLKKVNCNMWQQHSQTTRCTNIRQSVPSVPCTNYCMNALDCGLGTAPLTTYRGSEKGPFNLHSQVPCRENKLEVLLWARDSTWDRKDLCWWKRHPINS